MLFGGKPRGLIGESERGKRLVHMLLVLAAMLVMALAVSLFNVPNPNMLLITGLVAFTSLYGYDAGIVCSVVTVIYAMYFFSTDHGMFAYTTANLQSLAVTALSAALGTLFVGNLKRRQEAAERRLRELDHSPTMGVEASEADATTDDLTGARNRFALRRDYSRYANRDVHVLMVDMDNFKGINEQFGHSVGDYILRKLSQALVDSFGGEWCYRYGGDEFLVIIPDIQEGDFLAKLEQLKRRVKELDLDEKRLPVHFSAGYVHGVCELSYDLRLMMHQADSNLYDAKMLGKDCYVGRAFSRVFAETLPDDADGFGAQAGD